MTSRFRVLGAIIAGIIGVLLLEGTVALIILYSGWYNVAASRSHLTMVRWFLSTMMERSVKEHAAGVQAPAQASLREGAAHFAEMCALCHGAPDVERSEIGDGLNPRPPELFRTAPEWTLEEVYWIGKYGVKMTGMPAFGSTHTEDQLWAMAYFVKQLPELSPAQYRDLTSETGLGEQKSGDLQREGAEHQH
ncbi:MAG: c-type cytochrome [Solirubrobacterales bacterium]